MKFLPRLFPRRVAPVASAQPQLFLAVGCVEALQQCMVPTLRRRHEGVAFLLGRTDGACTVALTTVRPKATTGPGHFHVSADDMASVIAYAMDRDLEIVAQVHTHPVDAFHSDGDEDGANIRYDGFISIVLPRYGAYLPEFTGTAIYHYRGDRWSLLDAAQLVVAPAGVALDAA